MSGRTSTTTIFPFGRIGRPSLRLIHRNTQSSNIHRGRAFIRGRSIAFMWGFQMRPTLCSWEVDHQGSVLCVSPLSPSRSRPCRAAATSLFPDQLSYACRTPFVGLATPRRQRCPTPDLPQARTYAPNYSACLAVLQTDFRTDKIAQVAITG